MTVIIQKKNFVLFVYLKKESVLCSVIKNLKVMSQKIIFTYLVVYQSVKLSSVRKTRICEGTFSQACKFAKHSCPEDYIIREIRVV